MQNHGRRRAVYVILAPLLPLLLVLAACGGKSSAATTTATTTVTLHATDFDFQGVPKTVPAGRVHFVLANGSKDYQHELWVYPQNQPQLPDLLAEKAAGQTVDEATMLQNLVGHVEDVAPGKNAAFDATLAPGTYEMACFITSTIGAQTMVHYDLHMHAVFTVQ